MKTIKKQLKRAFTIVELVIVIAVIAVLAAVLIPTFVNVLDSANESVDEQAVANMNKALIADETLHGKPVNPSDAMEIIESAGYTVKGYVAQLSYNTIYWDSSTNRCLIYNSNEVAVTYPSDAVEKYTSVTASNLPEYWYQLDDAYVTTLYDTTKSFSDNISALSDGETLQLQSDVTLTSSDYVAINQSTTITFKIGDTTYTATKTSPLYLSDNEEVTIDLNGNTLTTVAGLIDETNSKTSPSTVISGGASLYIKNGTLVDGSGASSSTSAFSVEAGSSVTLENVVVESKGSVLYPKGDSAQINVINSTITTTGVYCVGTNAATVDNYGVIIHIDNSTLTSDATDYDSCVVMMNVEGTLEISDSTIIGQRQGVLVRAGTATITDTTISCTMKESAISRYEAIYTRTNMSYNKDGKIWSVGNEVAMGAVVVGNNNSGAYLGNANLTMTGCTLSYTITEDDDNVDYSEYDISLFVAANNLKDGTYYSTSVTLSEDCTVNNKVVKFDFSKQSIETNNGCTCNLTGYSGNIYNYYDSGWKIAS